MTAEFQLFGCGQDAQAMFVRSFAAGIGWKTPPGNGVARRQRPKPTASDSLEKLRGSLLDGRALVSYRGFARPSARSSDYFRNAGYPFSNPPSAPFRATGASHSRILIEAPAGPAWNSRLVKNSADASFSRPLAKAAW